MPELTKRGFNKRIQSVEVLEAIYDIVENFIKEGRIRYDNYLVYPDYINDLEEVKKLDRKLSKP